MSVILPGVILEKDTLVAAKALFQKYIPGLFSAGNPAKKYVWHQKLN